MLYNLEVKNYDAKIAETLLKKKVFHDNVPLPSLPENQAEKLSPDLERSVEHNMEMFLGPMVSGEVLEEGWEIPVITRKAKDGKISQEMVAHAEIDFETGETIKFTGKGLDNPKREVKVTFYLALGPYDTPEIAFREQFNRKGKGYLSYFYSPPTKYTFEVNYPQLTETAKQVLDASIQRYNSKSGAPPPDPLYFEG